MSDDITDQAERVLRLRWEQPGPDYPEPVPTGLVWLGDWASEHLGELVAELKTTRAQLAAVEALAEEWRYKGEFGWGTWQEGHGPDQEGYVLDSASSRIRAAIERTSQGVADV